VCNAGVRYFAENGIEMNRVITDKEYLMLHDGMSDNTEYKLICEQLLGFFNKIIQYTHQSTNHKSTDLATLIKKYVDDNYTKDLCLEKIAEELNVSVKYISKVFKVKLGINLSDYINNLRVTRIKKLLI
jgi:two-component system response regulator YesN